MKLEQVYTLMNDVTKEVLGVTDVILEDLSNVVDVGVQILSATAIDNYVKSLVNHIGRVVFVNRPYTGSAPSVLMDGWEFGSVMEKITAELPDATENSSWDLVDGKTYDPNKFIQPKVTAKFYNKRVTFEIDQSFTEMQVKESFSSAEQLNAFLSMLYTVVENAMTVKIDALVMRTINHFIAETVNSEYPSGVGLSGKSGVRAVNLLYKYNQRFNSGSGALLLTAEEALTDKDFIRFSALYMGLYQDRLSKISTLFNVGAKARFTNYDLQHIVMLSDFYRAASVYLQSDTFNDNLVSLPTAETVPYWQGSGLDYDYTSISSIDIKTAGDVTIKMSGIMGVMFDRDALGVSNLSRRVTVHYNPKAEFFTNFYKFEAGYFNDLNENFVVFFVA